MGLFSDLYGIFTGVGQNRQANAINPVYQQYTPSPYAKKQLGLAETLFNAPMPGELQERQDIETSQSNFNQNVNRNATDSSQALALEALDQGVTNNAFSDLQKKKAGYNLNMLGNLNAGYQTLLNEGDKQYQSMLDKYYSDLQQKIYYKNASQQNIFGALNDLGSSAFLTGSQMTGDNNTKNDKLGGVLSLAGLFL